MALRRMLQSNVDYTDMRLSSGYGQVVFGRFESSSWQVRVAGCSLACVCGHYHVLHKRMRSSSMAIRDCESDDDWVVSSSASARQQHDFQRFWVSFSSSVALVLALQKLSSLFGCCWVFFPELLLGVLFRLLFANGMLLASLFQVLGTLGFLFSAAAAFIVIANVIMPWKCCFSIRNSSGCELLCGHVLGLRQPHCAGAFSGAFVGFLAIVGLLSYAFEVLERHVLAGSLFSGTGEQPSGRVDVPGKDKQQQAAAAKEMPSMCFFVKSLGGASYVVKMEHHATGRTGQAARCIQVWGL